MPSPPKTTRSEIVRVARTILARNGRDDFSLNDVAATIGVRTPSLYGHFENRAALLLEVELTLWAELKVALTKAASDRDPVRRLVAQAKAYRAFAKSNPNGYALLYDANAPHSEAGVKARADALAPAWSAFAALAGEDHALEAARVLTPFLHGFVAMELSDAFRLGGGLDAAFENGVRTIVRGLSVRDQTRPHTKRKPQR